MYQDICVKTLTVHDYFRFDANITVYSFDFLIGLDVLFSIFFKQYLWNNSVFRLLATLKPAVNKIRTFCFLRLTAEIHANS